MASFRIQIQHLLKLNISIVALAKYKLPIQIQHLLKLNILCQLKRAHFLHSNTTLVKVKSVNVKPEAVAEINSNTTLVKVKSQVQAQTGALNLPFKYNTC